VIERYTQDSADGQRLRPGLPSPAGRLRVILGPLLLALVLVAGTILVYQPAWHAGFIWDDDDYVTNNSLLSAPDGLKRIWFSLESPSQYFPLVYTTFRLEHALWGMNPAGYHWTNILLHAGNALLVWWLLRRLKVPGAWLGAALFAWHPVQVESVAWITELKNVLSLFFFLLTLLAWNRFIQDCSKPARRFYWLALVFHLLGLCSKTTVCTLPVVLLLVLWLEGKPIGWPRLAQIVPFLALSVGMGLLTIWWERYHQGTQGGPFSISLLERILVASHAVWFYAGKLAWPAGLTFSYPRWSFNPGAPLAYGWLAACAGLCAVIFLSRRWVGRSVATAALFFVVTLSPLLGFIMLYTFRYSFVADHYQYIASIGPLALAAAGIATGFRFFGRQAGLLKFALCAALLVLLATLSWRQCRMYSDAETLWRTNLARNPASWLAHNNLGLILFQKGQVDRAMAHYQSALAANPEDMEAHNNLGNALLQQGRVEEALTHYEQALRLAPNCADPHYNLGRALFQQGNTDAAIAQYRKALGLNPRHAEANYNLGNALLQAGQVEEAIACYTRALEARPDFGKAHSNLGNVLLQQGRVDEAIAHYQRALAIDPDDAGTHYNLGNVLLQRGQSHEAIAHYQRALAGKPRDAAIHFNLGTAFLLGGQFDQAVSHYQAGLATRPDDAAAHHNLGQALLRLGRKDEALAQFKAALELKPDHEAALQQLRLLDGPASER
jgi:protein O-mannosyl-transferase